MLGVGARLSFLRRALATRRWSFFKWFWLALGAYDLVLSQLVPKSLSDSFPKTYEALSSVSDKLTWQAWLIGGGALVVAASIEFAFQRSATTKEAIVAASSAGVPPLDKTPATNIGQNQILSESVGLSNADDRTVRFITEEGRDALLKNDSLEQSNVEKFSLTAMFRRPAVAVLPFANMSGDPEQEYFADGLTEDLITALSLWRSFPVIARNSTFVYKGQSPDIREVGKSLGAKYVIEGSVRNSAGRVRVTAQLIDSDTGHHIWAERYDRELSDIFKLQAELSQNIAAAVAPELDFSQFPKIQLYIPQKLNAWELVQRGFGQVLDFDLVKIQNARGFFQQAIDLDPNYARAYIGLGWSYHRELWMDRRRATAEAKMALLEIAQKAVSCDEFDAEAHVILSFAWLWSGDIDRAFAEAQRAEELNPNNAQTHAIMGHVLALVGKTRESLASMEKAIFLSPRDPRQKAYLWNVGLAYLTEHNYNDAVLWLNRAIQGYSKNPDAHLELASALGHAGQIERAQTELDQFEHLVPDGSKKPTLVWGYKHDSDNEHLIEGLRKAGWKCAW